MRTKKKCVVLLSGGVDSATVLAIALKEGWNVTTITVDYGQDHEELFSARKIASYYSVDHVEMKIPKIQGSLLTGDSGTNVVPGRNMVLLSIAVSFAASQGMSKVLIGSVSDDAEDYPDCRNEFIDSMNSAARSYGITIEAPFVTTTKKDVVKMGIDHEVPYGMTHSCYRSSLPCGECPSCVLRSSAGL